MNIILQVLSVLIGAILIYLIAIIFLPILEVKPQVIKKELKEIEVPSEREAVTFEVGGMKISGWFYTPAGSAHSPCIVFSHGFCGVKDTLLEKYALKYVSQGYAVLLYDYRYFGDSEGEPRQLFSSAYQLEDLKAAIKYARSREEVDADKIVLWGTSAGATYGITAAAMDKRIAGVIAQCGSYDHKEDSKLFVDREGYGFFIKLLVHAQRDKGRSRFGLSPHMYPAYGKQGTKAFMTAPGTFEGVTMLGKESENFRNEVCARFLFMPKAPDPLSLADKVGCKVLIQVCGNDTLVSVNSHKRLAEILGGKAEIITYPISHFDIYIGEDYERVTDDQLSFLGMILS